MPSKKRRKPKSVPAAGSGAAAKQAAAPPEDAAAAAARREEQRRIWAQRKRAAERKPIPVALYAWLGGGGIAVVGVIVVAVLLLGGGGGDSAPVQTFVPDPRAEGPVDQTEEVIADDNGQAVNPTFSKTTIVGKAGDVIEIRMPNVGSVAHNLHVAGEDNEYSDDPAADDWITFPQTVQPGETGILRLKIDTPGTYEYRCDFHPIQQVGNLILS